MSDNKLGSLAAEQTKQAEARIDCIDEERKHNGNWKFEN